MNTHTSFLVTTMCVKGWVRDACKIALRLSVCCSCLFYKPYKVPAVLKLYQVKTNANTTNILRLVLRVPKPSNPLKSVLALQRTKAALPLVHFHF